MSKLITTTVLGFAMLAVLASGAQAAGRRRCSQTYAAAPVVAAPATTAQATGQGYRTFSYQPTTGVMYQPSRRAATAAPYMRAGQHSAGYKLTDF